MAESKGNAGGNNGGVSLSPRLIGQFILWAMMALVAWSFYTTLKHETTLTLLEHRVMELEKKYNRIFD